jgi:hypothetical protein
VFPTGKLAPDGAVIKATAIDPSVVGSDGVYRHLGPARVFVDERAKNIVQSLMKEQGLSDAKRVESLYLRIVNRMPAPDEVDSSLTYVLKFRQKLKGDQADFGSWQSLARVLISSNEFMYLD